MQIHPLFAVMAATLCVAAEHPTSPDCKDLLSVMASMADDAKAKDIEIRRLTSMAKAKDDEIRRLTILSLAINLTERRICACPSLSPAPTHSWKVAQYEKHLKALDFGHKS